MNGNLFTSKLAIKGFNPRIRFDPALLTAGPPSRRIFLFYNTFLFISFLIRREGEREFLKVFFLKDEASEYIFIKGGSLVIMSVFTLWVIL